MKHSYLHVPAD